MPSTIRWALSQQKASGHAPTSQTPGLFGRASFWGSNPTKHTSCLAVTPPHSLGNSMAILWRQAGVPEMPIWAESPPPHASVHAALSPFSPSPPHVVHCPPCDQEFSQGAAGLSASVLLTAGAAQPHLLPRFPASFHCG